MAADNAEAVAGFVAVARQRQAKRRRILADMRDMSEAVDDSRLSLPTAPVSPRGCTATQSRHHSEEGDIDIKVASVDGLLRIESYAEQEARAVTARVRTLLETPSAKERSLSAKCVDVTSVLCHRYADEVTETTTYNHSLTHRPIQRHRYKARETVSSSAFREFCPEFTAKQCRKARGSQKSCDKLHYRPIIMRHTDVSLGDCGCPAV